MKFVTNLSMNLSPANLIQQVVQPHRDLLLLIELAKLIGRKAKYAAFTDAISHLFAESPQSICNLRGCGGIAFELLAQHTLDLVGRRLRKSERQLHDLVQILLSPWAEEGLGQRLESMNRSGRHQRMLRSEGRPPAMRAPSL